MMLRWLVLAPLLTAATFATLYGMQRTLDATRPSVSNEELLFLPSEQLLLHFTGGLNGLVADLLWLQMIQYTAQEFSGQGKFTWLEQMTKAIVQLDPYYLDVYIDAGTFLAALKADDDASLEILRSGVEHRPMAWRIPWEMAMVHLLNRRGEPGHEELAARYLAMAVATGTAPPKVAETARGLQQRHNLDAIEAGMWREVLESPTADTLEKEVAERKLTELGIRQNCMTLTKAAQAFEDRTGSPPSSVQALIDSGIVRGIGSARDALGGRYIIQNDGSVASTTLLDERALRARNRIEAAIRRYEQAEGALPPNLDALIETRQLSSIPSHPYDNREWVYLPETGELLARSPLAQ